MTAIRRYMNSLPLNQDNILYLGNDLHSPINEMAAKLSESTRSHYRIPCKNIVSIQSRKPISQHESRYLIAKNWSGRLGQLYKLRKIIRHKEKPDIRLIHYWGDGKPQLNYWLIREARLIRAQIVFSPTGLNPFKMEIPQHAHIAFTHRSEHQAFCSDHNLPSTRHFVLAPLAPYTVDKQANPVQEHRILFASVPPKEKELRQRGIHLMMKAMELLSKKGISISLTILNRHAKMTSALDKLCRQHNLSNVFIDTRQIDEMEAYIQQFSILAAPFQSKRCPQVPLSLLEGMALGRPVIISSFVPLSKDIKKHSAGKLAETSEDFAAAANDIVKNYAAFSLQARELIRTHYSESAYFNQLKYLYSSLIEEKK